MSRFLLTIIVCVSCSWTVGMSKQVTDDDDDHQADSSVVSLPSPVPVPVTAAAAHQGGNRAILTSLLLGALAAANPSLTNTLLLTNPYLAAYFVPPLHSLRYPPMPIYGYTAINPFQDSSAFGSSYKRELKQ